ncbi:MAG: putative molybdenum carrier protein [Xanthomonadales bacterium]|jgi:hypothetical protein|nr:putative molybdenum carrier protein [Xanthomonadales bacterium]
MPRLRTIELHRIVSGGQTGVDRGALDAALERGFPCGGWCPDGRLAEDGPLPERYPLTELPGGAYADRTEANVRDSDATLILTPREPEGGTRLTRASCEHLGRPCLTIEFPPDQVLTETVEHALPRLRAFLSEAGAQTLNVAGPRASEWHEAYHAGRSMVSRLLEVI